MTPSQRDTFIASLLDGVSVGMFALPECYEVSHRLMTMSMPLNEWPAAIANLNDAYVAFLNDARLPEKQEYTLSRLQAWVDAYYDMAGESKNNP